MSAQNAHERPAIEEMAAVHRVFRREFRILPELVRVVAPGDKPRARVVAEHARLVLAGLHAHHRGEDAVLWPLLLERAAPRCDLVERMRTQHANIDRLTRRLDVLVDRFATIAQGRDDLARTLAELRAVLVDHLNLEEAEVVPLAAQHLSATEWSAMGRHATDRLGRRQLQLLVAAVLEEADAAERQIVLHGLPAPARVAATTVGAVQYRRYVERVRQGRTF